MVTLMCRLKAASSQSIANFSGILRAPLIAQKTEAVQALFASNKSGATLHEDRKTVHARHQSLDTKDVSKHEPWRRKLLATNGERNVSSCASSSRYAYTDLRDRRIEMRKYTGSRAVFLGGGSPIASRLSLPTIYRTWRFSKELCPLTGHGASNGRQLSNWSNVYSSMIPGRANDLCKRSADSRDLRRGFSSEGSSCSKTTKSGQCGDRATSAKGDVAKDCAATKCNAPSKLCTPEFYPECSQPCEPSLKDPCCKPRPPCSCSSAGYHSPCSNVDDYCPKEESPHERFWRTVVLFIAFPMLIFTAVSVYTREKKRRKEPRPEFIDLPYMRRIVKPYPWGDGRRTLFHNSEKNPLSPEGYLVEDPNAVKTDERKN